MTLLRVNFRGNVFVPLDYWDGKEAIGTQRLAIDHEFDLLVRIGEAIRFQINERNTRRRQMSRPLGRNLLCVPNVY